MSYGLLLVRLVIGGTMFGHGAQKLFGWFGGGGPQGTAGFMGQLGFRAPLLMAIAAGLGETGGVGLGLAITAEIARHHRGSLSLACKAGGGAIATLNLRAGLPSKN